MVYNNCESHKMGATKIPNGSLWHERWPVWGYFGDELVQSSYDFELSYMYICSSIECVFIRVYDARQQV